MTEPKEFYQQAMQAYGQEKYEESIGLYRKALEGKPEWTDAMLGLAMAEMNSGKLDDAIATCEGIIKVEKNNAFAYSTMSMCYQKKDMIPEAEDAQAKARMISWREELKNNPDAPPPAGPGEMRVIQ